MIQNTLNKLLTIVAPFAGAWIEIKKDKKCICGNAVAPFAGAWIEIKSGAITA